MAPRGLIFKHLSSVPCSGFVQREIERALTYFTDNELLVLDFDGTKNGDYELTFEVSISRESSRLRRRGCYYHAPWAGMSGEVDVHGLQYMNYCWDIYDCRSCRRVWENTNSQLGTVIANTALHELGHMFGLLDKTSYKGADEAGHTGDERNYMFDYPKHTEYAKSHMDYKRSKPYTIKDGENLSMIAKRIGFHNWTELYDFKNREGVSNRQILNSKDANRVFAGEVIAVPDIDARIEWLRRVEGVSKAFTVVQLRFMREWINAGKGLMQSGP